MQGSPLDKEYFDNVLWRLMWHRDWALLRYLHFREAFNHVEGVESVLVVGAGMGLAELALAIEFPDVEFQLGDIPPEDRLYRHHTEPLIQDWGIKNLCFEPLDILQPVKRKYDLVASIEVLEHIQNDVQASTEIRAASRRYVFTLVPFAHKEAQEDQQLQEWTMKEHEHYRVGYDVEDMKALFPGIVTLRGCYWRDRGLEFRERISRMEDDDIFANQVSVLKDARRDIFREQPTLYPEAQGIWALSEVR